MTLILGAATGAPPPCTATPPEVDLLDAEVNDSTEDELLSAGANFVLAANCGRGRGEIWGRGAKGGYSIEEDDIVKSKENH